LDAYSAHIGIATFLHLVTFAVELAHARGWTNFQMEYSTHFGMAH